MDELNWKDHLPRVVAPPDFEQRVLEALAAKKKRPKPFFFLEKIEWRWSLAAGAFLLLVFLGITFLLLPRFSKMEEGRGTVTPSSFSSARSAGSSTLVLTEPVDFREEFTSLEGSKIIYILEPVSDRAFWEVKY